MPVILTEREEIEIWLSAPTSEALKLQRPLPDDALRNRPRYLDTGRARRSFALPSGRLAHAAERIGAPAEIRLAELSIFNSLPRSSVMAAMKGYADDSRPGDKIWVVAAYVGADHKWEAFEEKWNALLVEHDVPYLHMTELGKPNGVYSKWHPLKEHQAEVAALFNDMTAAIGYSWLTGFYSIVRIADLYRFNSETGLKLEPYPLAAYGCLLMIANEYGNFTSQVFFDRVEKVHSKLEAATSYAKSDRHYGEALGNVALFPVQKGVTSKDLRPLQAADFFAWELQRNHLNFDEWHALPGRPMDGDERWRDFQHWSRHQYGTDEPVGRKSLLSLMERAAPVSGIIWDYDQIRSAHKLRGGDWGQA